VPATPSNYRIDHYSTYSAITLLPGLNDAQWSDIEQAGNDIMSRLTGMRTPAVLVDLTPLNYMGSSMVAMIVRCWKNVQANNGKIVVVSNNDVVREVISLAGLTKVWPMVTTREEAIQTLGVTRSGGNFWFVAPGLVAVLCGAVGAGLLLAGRGAPPLALGLLFGGAGVGFVLGLVMLIGSSPARRYWGLGFVLASVAIAILGFLNLREGSVAEGAPAAEEEASAEEAADSEDAAVPEDGAFPDDGAIPDDPAAADDAAGADEAALNPVFGRPQEFSPFADRYNDTPSQRDGFLLSLARASAVICESTNQRINKSTNQRINGFSGTRAGVIS
jgi:anti-anti-sigma factor